MNKKEKLIPVYVLCPYDMELPVRYFTDRTSAITFAATYESGAFISEKPELIPERILRSKDLHIARHGNKL